MKKCRKNKHSYGRPSHNRVTRIHLALNLWSPLSFAQFAAKAKQSQSWPYVPCQLLHLRSRMAQPTAHASFSSLIFSRIKSRLPSSTFAKIYFFSLNSKTRQTKLPQLLKPFILPPWPYYKQFWRWLCLFLFLFISDESLKNHSKSQKNHKMKNLILLDSTWVDLHSEYIIWYALVQNFCCSFRSMFLCN